VSSHSSCLCSSKIFIIVSYLSVFLSKCLDHSDSI
jgi:hypothetical protein